MWRFAFFRRTRSELEVARPKLTWEHIVAVALAVTPGSGFYVGSRM